MPEFADIDGTRLNADFGCVVAYSLPDALLAAWWAALARSLGWSASFETARMYRGPAPLVDLARLYGVASFELG